MVVNEEVIAAPRARDELAQSVRDGTSGRALRSQILRYVPGSLGPAAMGLAFTMVFTRMLTSEEFGRYSLVLSASALLSSLASQWLTQGVNRFMPGRATAAGRARLRGSVAVSLLGVAAAVTVMGVAATLVGWWIAPPAWRGSLAAGAALTVASSLFYPLGALLQAEMRAGRYSLYQLAWATGRFLAALGFAMTLGAGSAALLWGWALATAILVPALWRDAAAPPLRRVVGQWRRLAAGGIRMARYGFPMTGWVLSAVVLEVGDRYIIQFTRGAAEVGIYSANYNLVVGAVALVTAPVLLAAHPFLMRAWGSGDEREAARWLGRIVEWFAIIGVLLVGTVGVLSRDIAAVLLGAEFRPGYAVIPVVLAGVIIWQLGMYVHKPLEFVGRTRLLFALAVGAAVVNLVLNLALVPRYGYVAAAYATAAAYLLYVVATAHVGRRILPWRVEAGRVVGAILPFLVAVGAVLAARPALEASLGYAAALVIAIVALAAGGAAVVLRSLPALFSPGARGAG